MSDLGTIQDTIERDSDRICAVVYAHSNQIPGYVWLTKCLSDAGHLGIFCHHKHTKLSDEERDILNDSEIVSVTLEGLALLQGVDVYFSNELDAVHAPAGAVTVGIFHSLLEDGPGSVNISRHFSRNNFLVKTLDYFALARVDNEHFTHEEFAPFVENIFPQELLRARRSRMDIIPAGYPKIDFLQNALHSDDLDTIFYGPTNLNLPFAEVGEWGERMISRLLEAFPKHKVVFRPYPSGENAVLGAKIGETFTRNTNFVLDTTRDGMKYLQNSALIISDISSMGLSFALATGRPYISSLFNAQKTGALALLKSSVHGQTPTEKLLGFRTHTMEQLVNAVQHVLDNRTYWYDKIMRERGKFVYNPGDSCRYLAESLPIIAKGGSRDDWLSLERKPWTGLDDPERAVGHVQSLLQRGCVQASREVADLVIARHPEVQNEVEALYSPPDGESC